MKPIFLIVKWYGLLLTDTRRRHDRCSSRSQNGPFKMRVTNRKFLQLVVDTYQSKNLWKNWGVCEGYAAYQQVKEALAKADGR